MRTREEILFYYAQAVRQADRLEETAVRLRVAASSELAEILSETGAAWNGESAKKYIQKGEQVKQTLTARSHDMRKLARTIREIAERVKATEMEAIRIANEREYH